MANLIKIALFVWFSQTKWTDRQLHTQVQTEKGSKHSFSDNHYIFSKVMLHDSNMEEIKKKIKD